MFYCVFFRIPLYLNQEKQMMHLSPQQRVEVIKTFYLNNRSIVNTRRKLRDFFGANHVPSISTIRRTVHSFETLYTLEDKPKPGRTRSVRTPEIIDAVRESVAKYPGTSIRQRAQELGISHISLSTILKKDLQLGVTEENTNENSDASGQDSE